MCDFSQYGAPSEEWLAIEATQPAAGPDPGIAELRRITNAGRDKISQTEMVDMLDQIDMQDYSIPTRDNQHLEARTYRPSASESRHDPLPTYMHLHGGGFLFGTLQSEDAICSRIALTTGVMVLNVNYRHTPEHVYPTAWHDGEDALIWLCSNADSIGGDLHRLVLGGVSAGAYITAALVQTVLRGELAPEVPETLKILGQVLMIPCLVFSACYDSQLAQLKDLSVSSYAQASNAPILNMERKTLFNSLLQVTAPDPNDRRLNPANATAEEVKRLPPTTLGIAGNDPLRDEGLLYGKKLSKHGYVLLPREQGLQPCFIRAHDSIDNHYRVPTNINVFKGLPHGFRRYGKLLSASAHWDNTVNEGIRWALSHPAATNEFSIRVF